MQAAISIFIRKDLMRTAEHLIATSKGNLYNGIERLVIPVVDDEPLFERRLMILRISRIAVKRCGCKQKDAHIGGQ